MLVGGKARKAGKAEKAESGKGGSLGAWDLRMGWR